VRNKNNKRSDYAEYKRAERRAFKLCQLSIGSPLKKYITAPIIKPINPAIKLKKVVLASRIAQMMSAKMGIVSPPGSRKTFSVLPNFFLSMGIAATVPI